MKPQNTNIVFFDGVCNLCNGFIDFLITRDHHKQLYYCSLQTDKAKEILGANAIEISADSLSTIYFYSDGQIMQKSTAILKMLKKLSGGYRIMASVLLVIPRPVRDFMYMRIANNRYLFFGKKSTCRLPSPEERAQFL